MEEGELMKKRQLILACVLSLFCIAVPVACNNHDESIDDSLVGKWGGDYGPRYVFFENGTYEGYSGIKIVGNYTTRNNEIILQLPVKYRTDYNDYFSYTYSITGDTLTLTTEDGETFSYIRLE